MIQLVVRWMVLALGVTLATKIVPGIAYEDTSTLVVVVILLSFLNAVLKPLLVLFTLPFIIFTMGLGIVLINALLFLLVSRLVDGFFVESFGSALLGAIIVSVTNLVLSTALRSPKNDDDGPNGRGSGSNRRGSDVIDV
jgi:putative membrane protein